MNKNDDLLENEHFFSMSINNVTMNLLYALLTYQRLIVLTSHFDDPEAKGDKD